MTGLALALAAAPAVAQQGDDEWEDWGDDPWAEEDPGLVWTGFVEGAGGPRLQSFGPTDFTLGELRARLETEYFWKGIDFNLKADLGYDAVADDDLTHLRELSAQFSLGNNIDVKAGRQVLTWGTGDLVFLNDLFPKDFVSFFIGRDDEYLKAAGNAVKVSGYTDWFNIDFVWTPDFDSDQFITGERLAFFSPAAGAIVSPPEPIGARTPDDSEFAWRFFRTIDGVEYALYGYDGYFKQPNAVSEDGVPSFAEMRSLGASVRGSLGSGVANFEFAWYDSLDDGDGSNPGIPNSQLRFLVGYDWEAVTNFNVGLQYYLEWTQDHERLIANSPAPRFEPDEYRSVFTNRLTYRMMRDKLTLSAFTFYSPSDDDVYTRPSVNYRYSDAWQFTVGANLFAGDDEHTFFGQLEDNVNAYARMRFYF